MNKAEDPLQNTRSSPRATVPLDVDVEVAGETRRVGLVSRDIGAGGMFLRTDEPAPLWKRVRMSIKLPEGGEFEITGEVVRCVSPEDSAQKKHPAGMAVAFDEVSRAKRKELVALVLDLCSRRPQKAPAEQSAAPPRRVQTTPARQPEQPVVVVRQQLEDLAPVVGTEHDPDDHFSSRTDALLGQLDDLLDSVEQDPIVPAPEKTAPKRPQPPPPPVADLAPPPAADPFARLRKELTSYCDGLIGDTHYDALRIDRKATIEQINHAYQSLLARLKPPGSPESMPESLVRDLSQVLGKVRKAFAILGKPDRKRAYDFLIDNSDDEF